MIRVPRLNDDLNDIALWQDTSVDKIKSILITPAPVEGVAFMIHFFQSTGRLGFGLCLGQLDLAIDTIIDRNEPKK